MKKKHFQLLILFLFINVVAFSQTSSQEESKRLTKLQKELEGTYQIQVIDSREMVAFPLKTLDIIEEKRDGTKTIYFWLKNNVKIMVLPRNEISKKSFKPLAPQTVYLSSETSK